MISYILAIICGLLFLFVDQLTKFYIMTNFELGEGCNFINGIIDIIYIHNRGGAWGILQGKTWVLLLITAVLMISCIILLLKYGKKNKFLFWSIILILAGGLGNMIDRIFRYGNVVDFLHFEFFPTFPIFNVADCAVVLGAGLLIAYFIFDTINDWKIKKPRQATENNNG